MKSFSLILVALLFTSCATRQTKSDYVPLSERRIECVKQLLFLDVKPLEAAEICEKAHQQR